ncbi:MAG: hypothetical protein JWL84_6053 [Rhodospirillales bacterium]|nr:hypothetical protein [Rhodospirillales bacterium]
MTDRIAEPKLLLPVDRGAGLILPAITLRGGGPSLDDRRRREL